MIPIHSHQHTNLIESIINKDTQYIIFTVKR